MLFVVLQIGYKTFSDLCILRINKPQIYYLFHVVFIKVRSLMDFPIFKKASIS